VITLTSKESQQIEFPGGAPSLPVLGALTVTVETGVAVFAFVGTHAHDWTRDTLSFPVGGPCTAGEFVSGIASAAPASFWTPYSLTPAGSSVGPDVELVVVQPIAGTSAGGGLVFIPPLGFAVDAAAVSYSAAAGSGVLQLSLAVFGTSTSLMRVSYTAFIVQRSGGVIVGGEAGSTQIRA
jgi:hypothetical protein